MTLVLVAESSLRESLIAAGVIVPDAPPMRIWQLPIAVRLDAAAKAQAAHELAHWAAYADDVQQPHAWQRWLEWRYRDEPDDEVQR